MAKEGQGYPCCQHDMMMMIYIYIYAYVCVCVCVCVHTHTHSEKLLANLVEGDLKAPFPIATTLRCRGGCYVP